MTAPADLFTCPADLTLVGDDELTTLHDAAVAEFNRINGGEITPDVITYATQITNDLDRIAAEQSAREVRATAAATAQRDTAAQTMAALATRVNGPAEPTETQTATPGVDLEAVAAAATQGATAAMLSLLGERQRADVVRRASLGETARVAPDPQVPVTGQQLRTVSAIDLPARQLSAGSNVPDLESLADLVINRAQGLAVTQHGDSAPRHPVASIRNEFAHTIDDRTSPAQVERLVRELTKPERQEALLAGGGWCAPSEIRYDLFNISDTPSGLIDLPSVGVSRGGIQYPVSPSIKDVFFTAGGSNPATGMGGFAATFSNASDPWLWTEADDIATVTGTVNKPTLRVPCPTFNQARLEAYGLTLTAGNLTDSAYPEATQNFLRLLRNAYAHTVNARLISLMVAAATSGGTIGTANAGAYQTVVNTVALAATDYRQRFGMADNAVLEVVFPIWVMEIMRADLAWRVYGDDTLLSVPEATIRNAFAVRGVNAQFVSDYQVRGNNQFGQPSTYLTAWPTTVQFMLYAAGTFLHGEGMTLDLGVVRDSVLNAENDYTAAWMESTHLVAMVGHQAMKYTVNLTVNGAGSAGLTPAANV